MAIASVGVGTDSSHLVQIYQLFVIDMHLERFVEVKWLWIELLRELAM